MNIFKLFRKVFDKITKAKYFYVTFDVSPDFTTGQGEMCSYTVKAPNQDQAVIWAKEKAMIEWGVTEEAVWLVECVETNDDDLKYNS